MVLIYHCLLVSAVGSTRLKSARLGKRGNQISGITKVVIRFQLDEIDSGYRPSPRGKITPEYPSNFVSFLKNFNNFLKCEPESYSEVPGFAYLYPCKC